MHEPRAWARGLRPLLLFVVGAIVLSLMCGVTVLVMMVIALNGLPFAGGVAITAVVCAVLAWLGWSLWRRILV